MIHPTIIDKINRERREREHEDHRIPLYVPLPIPRPRRRRTMRPTARGLRDQVLNPKGKPEMLSPNSLERATASYRRGYYDGYGGHPHAGASDSLWRPFDGGDYMRG